MPNPIDLFRTMETSYRNFVHKVPLKEVVSEEVRRAELPDSANDVDVYLLTAPAALSKVDGDVYAPVLSDGDVRVLQEIETIKANATRSAFLVFAAFLLLLYVGSASGYWFAGLIATGVGVLFCGLFLTWRHARQWLARRGDSERLIKSRPKVKVSKRLIRKGLTGVAVASAGVLVSEIIDQGVSLSDQNELALLWNLVQAVQDIRS